MEVTAESFDLHMALHLRAPFLLTQVLAPAMAAPQLGADSSTSPRCRAIRAFPNSAPYGAGKGGVVQLTRAIARGMVPPRRHLQCHRAGVLPHAADGARSSADPERSAAQNAAADGQSAATASLPISSGATVFLAIRRIRST